MKRRTKVTKARKIGGLKASAPETKHPLHWNAELYRPIKKPVTLRLDADVLAWFRKSGPGYQTRINRALRKVMLEKRWG